MVNKILKGRDYHMKLPTESLGKQFYDCLLKYKDKPAFIDEYTGEIITYDKVFEITCRLAGVYQNIKLKTGDMIAIYSENSIYYFLPMIAAFFLGITAIPISHYYLENELRHALNLTKPSVLFCSKRKYENILKIKNEFPFIKYVILMDFDEIAVDNFTTIIDKYGNKNYNDLVIEDVNISKTIALIMFSSGTTGLPKGVMVTHKNYISRMIHCWDPHLKYFDPRDVSLGYLPFFHATGLITYTSAILLGTTVRVFWKFDEHNFLKALQNYKIHSIAIVPSLAVFLAKSPIVDEYDLSHLEDVIIGGAALSESTEKRLSERLNVKYIRQAFGMTETTLNVTCIPYRTRKTGSTGKLVPGMMGAIRDPQSGKLLGSYQIGELIIKGDMVTAGYYNNPQASQEIFHENGFLRTGDLAYYDEEEDFFIVDRLKELIKYREFQVSPAEIEGLLLKHPKILDVGVVGVPDEKCGELPKAFVVKQPNAQDLTAEEVIQYVSENLSHQKRLRGGVQFVDAIPKNASGKILRRVLKKMINNDTKAKL